MHNTYTCFRFVKFQYKRITTCNKQIMAMAAATYSDDDLRAFIQDTTKLKETTKMPYLANLNTISRVTGGAPLHTVIADAQKWYPVLESRTRTTGTLRTLVKTLLAVCKYAGIKDECAKTDATSASSNATSASTSTATTSTGTTSTTGPYRAWYSHFMDLSKVLQQRADNNVPTAATELTWEQIIKARDQLKPGTIEHVTLALYTYTPPRRQQDYWKLALVDANATVPVPGNSTGHMDLYATPPTMTITAFKTNTKFPAYTTTLSPPLVHAIKTYLKAQGQGQATAKRAYLFCKRNGEPYATLSSFTDANNTVIKKALNYPHASVNSIRHAGASYVAMNASMLYGERKAYAHAMGHSLAMQGQYVVAVRNPARGMASGRES